MKPLNHITKRVCVGVFSLCWGSAAWREEPVGNAPTGGYRPGLYAGGKTTAPHLFSQTVVRKNTQVDAYVLKENWKLLFPLLVKTDIEVLANCSFLTWQMSCYLCLKNKQSKSVYQPLIVSSSLFLRISVTSLALALRLNVGALWRQL